MTAAPAQAKRKVQSGKFTLFKILTGVRRERGDSIPKKFVFLCYLRCLL